MATPTDVADRYRLERGSARAACRPCSWRTRPRARARVAVKLLAEHLAEDEAFVARFRREALSAAQLAPQHRPGVRLRQGRGLRAATTSSWSTSRGPPCADLIREESSASTRRSATWSTRATGSTTRTAPASCTATSSRATCWSSGEADVKLADFGIAKAAEQTRITQVGLGARHRRVPVTRAGARRGGRTRLRHLLARRVRVPVPGRPPAARVQLADRARAEAAERRGRVDRPGAPGGPGRARPRDPGRAPRRPERTLQLGARDGRGGHRRRARRGHPRRP